MRTLVILAAIIILVLVFNSFSKSSPQLAKKMLTRLAIGGAIAAFVFLLLTGRMSWLVGLVGTAFVLLGRFRRYLPWLALLNTRFNSSASQKSTVQSRYLKMSLDHKSGDMDGEILLGAFEGQQLSTLSLSDLLTLYQEFSDDNDSLALLHTYLDRHHPDWTDQAGDTHKAHNAHNATPDNIMSDEEAREILGVEKDSSKKDIITAHRRLMQKVHPDHGGSTYLAAKINLAKDYLLK